MGCGGSSPDDRDRLDKVEATISRLGKGRRRSVSDAGPSDPKAGEAAAEGLDVAAQCAAELRAVMASVVAKGAKDTTSLHRIEVLSESVLGNLESRVCEALLTRRDADELVSKMKAIATDLDAVRATRATVVLDEMVKKCRDRMIAAKEEKAQKQMPQLKQTLDGIKDPSQLVPGATSTLDLMWQVHQDVPTSKSITDRLLKAIQELARKILAFRIAWGRNPERSAAVKALASRLDELAVKLVAVMGATWDPPMMPQVERCIQEETAKLFVEAVAGAEREIANRKCGKAFEFLVLIKPHWPNLKGDSSNVLQVVGTFSKLQSLAVQDFIAVAKAGQGAVAGQIREFATKFDGLRAEFEGLPPASGGPLKDCLETGDATVAVERQIVSIRTLLAKPTDDESTLQLSFSGIVQALDTMVPVWEKITGKDDVLSRFTETCGAIEAWVDQLAAAAGPARIGSVLTCAEEYDQRRAKLPPEPLGGALKPRIALQTAEKQLAVAEAELAKASGLNPPKLLDAIKAIAAALPDGDAGAGLRLRLQAAMETTTERMLKSMHEAIAAKQARKEEALLQFGHSFDEAFGAAGLTGTLVEQLSHVKDGDIIEKLQALEAAVAASDLRAAAELLQALQPRWARIAEQPALKERARAVLAALPGACEAAAEAAADAAAGAALLELACKLDMALPPDDLGLGSGLRVRPRVVWIAARQRLDALDFALGDPGGTDPAVVNREVCAVAKLAQEAADPKDILERLADMRGNLERHLLQRAFASEAALTEVLDVAAQLDAATKGSLQAKVEQVQPAVQKVVEARTELAKPAGMDPRVVVKALKAIGPIWASWCSSEEIKQSLAEPFARILQELVAAYKVKLCEALQKAVDSGVDVPKKAQALLALAKDANGAQEPLAASLAALQVVDVVGALSVLLVEEAFSEAEKELAKETGLDPGKVLKSCTQAAHHWSAAVKVNPELSQRCDTIMEQVRTRMGKSTLEAKEAGNQKKLTMLLEFATKFDAAVAPMRVSMGLHKSLQGKMQGTTSIKE